MAETKLLPVLGINTKTDELQRENGRYVEDAVNLDISPFGQLTIRPGAVQVSPIRYANLWQSPLHRDTFATLGGEWVRVDPVTWSHESLIEIGDGPVSHAVLNNHVILSAPSGIYRFDGVKAERLTLETPPPPLAISGDGSLVAGTYGVAVAWLRGGQESATSAIAFVDVDANGALAVTLPLCLDSSVTGARLYLTRPDGGELLTAGDYPLAQATIPITTQPEAGRPSQFTHLEPMPPGQFLAYWRGRLLTAKSNVLRWSQALAYHLHDPRHDFVQMPQRITFVQPVDGGVWVGQVDHVAFLAGTSPDGLVMQRKASRPPVAGSAILLHGDDAGGASPDGSPVALWLAENGYVLGTSAGAVMEIHGKVLSGIAAAFGTTVVLDGRAITAVT